ncbi:MAG: CHC2 zinc finger domain-containing protein [Chloroflexota bacterium]
MTAGAEGLRYWQALFTDRARAKGSVPRGRLDRASLPAPAAYLAEHATLVTRPRGEWVSIRCPAHKGGDESHPSMRVSLVDGHFFCHACGAKGGDVIALHRLVTGLGFLDAVRDIGGRFHD